MSYDYREQRPNLFTEDGVVLFMKIRDRAHRLLKLAGAARMQELMSGCTGDTWNMLASVDRLVELGELREIPQDRCAGQHRVFVATRES